MKRVFLLIMLLLITGCDKSNIKKTYENMIDKSYEVDIKINGTNDGKRVNDSIRITNYKNKEYKIFYLNENKIIYKFNNKSYIKENDNYIENNDINYYTNPKLYLELLKGVKKVDSKETETINNVVYDVYNVSINKDDVNKLIEDTTLKGKKTNNDAFCKLYITSDKSLYRTNCDLKNNIKNTSNIKIDITYFNMGKVDKII